jgi:hypothetical protein
MPNLEGDGKLEAVQQQSSAADSFRAEAVNSLHGRQHLAAAADTTLQATGSAQLPQIHLYDGREGIRAGNYIAQQEHPQSTEHEVKRGDSLWKIARENLPTGASNADIANYVNQIEVSNPMPNPNLIMPGQSIKLPKYEPSSLGAGEQHHDKLYDTEHVEHHHRHHIHHHKDSPVTDHHTLPPTETAVHKEHMPVPPEKPPAAPPEKPEAEDKPSKPNETQQETHPVAEELHHLRALTHRTVTDKAVLSDIEHSAQELAATEQQKIDLYKLHDKSLTDAEARTHARAEITDTYRQAERLLPEGKPAKLSRNQLQITAAEMLHHAAHPEHIDQGQHKTCQTTAMESMIYKIEPSKAAKLVADVALAGQFTAYDGTTVKINPEPQDIEAAQYPVPNKFRSLASQIFQETAINLAWAKKDPTGKTHYVEMQTDPDKSNKIETLIQEPGSSVSIDPKYIHTPYLSAANVATMHNLITGKPQEAMVVEAVKQCDPETICVSSADNLAKRLQQRKEEGKLPIILYVNTAVDGPLKTPGGDWHAILATDFIGGENPKIRYYNWWGQASTNKEIGIGAVYKAMQGS